MRKVRPTPLQLGLLGFIHSENPAGRLYLPKANGERAAAFGICTENWERIAKGCVNKGYLTAKMSNGLLELTYLGRKALGQIG